MNRRDAESKAELRERLLVLRCQAGDESAFAELHHRYSPRVRRYVVAFLGPDAAEDVVQEVWLAVFRRIREVTNPGGFRAWLFRTARHRAIDSLRAEKRRSRLAREAFAEVAYSSTGSGELTGVDTESLTQALATLSPDHREVVQLRFFEELTYADIASITGCAMGTVRSRIHNAKARLREALGEAGLDLTDDNDRGGSDESVHTAV
jgi:RNA polymerase sigma-70 factor (ECF subfamily)